MGSFEWAKQSTPVTHVPPAFILPEEQRPQLSDISILGSIPIIDLKGEDLVEKVSRACEEYGFFRIINHGVPDELCSRIMDAVNQVFEMSPDEKVDLFSEDPRKELRLFSRKLNFPGSTQQEVLMWSESLFHNWYPSQDFTALLASTPPQYREVIGEYTKEISKLLTQLLSLTSLGLGLDKDYIESKHGRNPRCKVQANYYPPCPDPRLVLGLSTHTDPNTLTILQQSDRVSGLQVIKDDKWVSVEPLPKSFVVNVGDQLQVLSNGRYKSVHHRAVTNEKDVRVSMAAFFGPDEETEIGPIEELVDEEHPPLYRSYLYKEFVQEFYRQDGSRRRVKEAFQI